LPLGASNALKFDKIRMVLAKSQNPDFRGMSFPVFPGQTFQVDPQWGDATSNFQHCRFGGGIRFAFNGNCDVSESRFNGDCDLHIMGETLQRCSISAGLKLPGRGIGGMQRMVRRCLCKRVNTFRKREAVA
jgi:hypothetical protein